jgi:hypothetical protein
MLIKNEEVHMFISNRKSMTSHSCTFSCWKHQWNFTSLDWPITLKFFYH